MTHAVLSTPADSSSSQIADWLEIVMLSQGRRILSPGKARDLLASSGAIIDDLDVGLAFSVLHARSDRQLRLYPFRFSRLGLERDESVADVPYAFLVLVAAASDGSISLAADSDVAIQFERLVSAGLRGLFGPQTQVIRFGYPPEPGRPPGFQEAITWLAAKLNVRPLPLAGKAFFRNDGGIDVIALRPFSDRLPPIVVAVQVSMGEDLRWKSLEIAANELDKWMRIPKPAAALATPFDSDRDVDLTLEIGTRVILIDRWRLLRCLGENDSPNEALAQWSHSTLASVTL